MIDRDVVERLFDANLAGPSWGRGADPFVDELHDYPEAYAQVGRAAHALGRSDVARDCADWLLASRPASGAYAWGLPFDWSIYSSQRVIPAGSAFVVTTVAALQLLLDVARDVDLTWLVEHAHVYGEHQDARFVVWNSQAQAAGALARADLNLDHADVIGALATKVISEQHYGLWAYGVDKPYVFEYHQAMLLEGLTHVARRSPIPTQAIARGLDATWRVLFSDTGESQTSPERSAPWPAQHHSLMALVYAMNGQHERAELVANALLRRYVNVFGEIVATPAGRAHVRPAAGAISHLAQLVALA